ncbi:ankyrin repeat domain-containing protein [Rhodococcus sp. D2-41]|nr:ankyrin repeat domain-containing protein [Rhodococcus sp. D2-41]
MIWDGAGVALSGDDLQLQHKLADAAKRCDWAVVAAILEEEPRLVNSTRPGGPSLFAPLHQAAYANAPVEVIRDLVARGGWLTLENARGERPVDVATRRGHNEAAAELEPRLARTVPYGVLAKIQQHFHEVIRGRVADLVEESRLRLPELQPLLETETCEVYFPVPGMYGGFSYCLEEEGVEAKLVAESWCRVAGGSGQRHEITSAGSTLVAEGFV